MYIFTPDICQQATIFVRHDVVVTQSNMDVSSEDK